MDVKASELANPNTTSKLTTGTARSDVEVEFVTDAVSKRATEVGAATARAVPEEAAPTTARTSARLPRNLQRSAPRFGRNELDFASDVDKALYTVADGVKRSKADDQFMQFLRANFPDASDSTIRASGKELKGTIKAAPKTAGETLAVPNSQIVPGRVVPRSAPPASGTPEFTARSGTSETQLRAMVNDKNLSAADRKIAQGHLNKVCK